MLKFEHENYACMCENYITSLMLHISTFFQNAIFVAHDISYLLLAVICSPYFFLICIVSACSYCIISVFSLLTECIVYCANIRQWSIWISDGTNNWSDGSLFNPVVRESNWPPSFLHVDINIKICFKYTPVVRFLKTGQLLNWVHVWAVHDQG